MKSLLLLSLLVMPSLALADLTGDADKLARDHAAAVSRLNLDYANKLDELLARAKADGNTTAATRVEALIAEVEGKPAAAGATTGLLDPIVGTWKRDIDGSLWRFAANGKGSFNNKGKLNVSYDPEKKQFVSVADKSVDYFTVTRDPDLLNGTHEKDGRTIRFKLERIK